MKILVTGGTGFLGIHIVEGLLDRGFTVYVLMRNASMVKRFPRVRPIFGDLMSLSTYDLKGFEIVIHSAAIKTGFAGDSDYRLVNEEGTRHLLNVCVEAGVRRFIHISSMAVHVNRGDIYSVSKRVAERYVEESALEWSILRLGSVYGLSHWWLSYLSLLKQKKILVVIGDGNHLVYQIYVKDCAQAIINSIFDETISYRICCITSDPITYNHYLSVIESTLHANYVKVYIPLWMARIIGLIMRYILKSSKPHYLQDPRTDLSLEDALRIDAYARTFELGLEEMLMDTSLGRGEC